MMMCLEILINSARKVRKKIENSGIRAKFHCFISFFQSPPSGPEPVLHDERPGLRLGHVEAPLAAVPRAPGRPHRPLARPDLINLSGSLIDKYSLE